MAAHQTSLRRACALLLVSLLIAATGFGQTTSSSRPAAGTAGPPQRIVSLVPSVTEMLFAVGAGPRVVGVSNFDDHPPEAKARTRVGGLIDPDVERILSLKPDLIVVYGTQSELLTQMTRAGIPVFRYEHAGLPDVTTTIRAIGARVGSQTAANALADRIDADIAATRARVAGRPRPKTMLVFGRDSEALRGIYASGGIGFLHDMLTAAGGDDVFADVPRQSVQATSEIILARAPEVILEVSTSSAARNLSAWNMLGAVPAVRNKRIYDVPGDDVVVPGPRVADAVRRLSRALHPEAWK